MSFYIRLMDIVNVGGHTKHAISKMRGRGKIPYELDKNGVAVYDMDNPQIRALLTQPPKTLTEEQRIALAEVQREFIRRRKAGELPCALTGEVDLMCDLDDSFTSIQSAADEEQLDIKKKLKDIEHTEEKIKKLRLTHEAMRGGLIERSYVSAYIDRYLGTLHQQHLELASNGIADELYNISHRNSDSRTAIKEIEKHLADALAGVLKGAVASMEKNPV